MHVWQTPLRQLQRVLMSQSSASSSTLFLFVLNGVEMPLPSLSRRTWHRAIDTAQPSSGDIFEPSDQPGIKELCYRVSSHSVVLFESR